MVRDFILNMHFQDDDSLTIILGKLWINFWVRSIVDEFELHGSCDDIMLSYMNFQLKIN